MFQTPGVCIQVDSTFLHEYGNSFTPNARKELRQTSLYLYKDGNIMKQMKIRRHWKKKIVSEKEYTQGYILNISQIID